jgi:hypothetical protein
MWRKAMVDHQIQSPLAWEVLEEGSQLGLYTVIDVALPVKLHCVSYMYSIYMVVHTLRLLLCV